MKTILENKNIKVTYTEHNGKCITIADLKDKYNEPRAFTQNIRGIGIGKAVAFIEHLATLKDLKDGYTFTEIKNILDDKFNLKTHYYCAMD